MQWVILFDGVHIAGFHLPAKYSFREWTTVKTTSPATLRSAHIFLWM